MLSVHIRKRLGDFFLQVDFDTDHSKLALLGISGCGKSVTLKCIAGILKPDEGTIVLNGRTLFDSAKRINVPTQKRNIGFLFQDFALFPNMTVSGNILAALHNSPGYMRSEKLRQALEQYHIEDLKDLYPHQLSGGQKQRVALARIMVQKPELLLFDEPFSAMDQYLRFQMELELLDTLNGFSGDVIYVSHSRSEVSTICEEVCVINNGVSEKKETVADLMSHPRTVGSALLSRCANFTSVTPEKDDTYYSEEWNMTFHSTYENAYPITSVGIRAPMVQICESHRSSSPNVFACTIMRIVEDVNGDILMLLPEGARTTTHFLRMDCRGRHMGDAHKIGDRIMIRIEPEHIMLLTGTLEKRSR